MTVYALKANLHESCWVMKPACCIWEKLLQCLHGEKVTDPSGKMEAVEE